MSQVSLQLKLTLQWGSKTIIYPTEADIVKKVNNCLNVDSGFMSILYVILSPFLHVTLSTIKS